MDIAFYKIDADPQYNDVLYNPDEFLVSLNTSPRHFLIENLPDFQIKMEGFSYDLSPCTYIS